MFFTISQNNSGGLFDYDEKIGITHFVIIEADDVGEAEVKFNSLIENPAYDRGFDCPCCGDRWYFPDREDGDKTPQVHGMDPLENVDGIPSWIRGYNVFIHYADGRIVGALDGGVSR